MHVPADDTFREIESGPVGRTLPGGRVESVAVSQDGLDVGFAACTVTLDTDWLRDNCPCPICRIVQTDERRWEPWRDANRAEVVHATVEDGDLVVAWASGHVSRYTPETWATIDRAMRRGRWTTRLWSAGYTIDRFDHDATVN